MEGEVVEIQIDRSVTGSAKQVKLPIKTIHTEAVYNIGNKTIGVMTEERVTAGDVFSIDSRRAKSLSWASRTPAHATTTPLASTPSSCSAPRANCRSATPSAPSSCTKSTSSTRTRRPSWRSSQATRVKSAARSATRSTPRWAGGRKKAKPRLWSGVLFIDEVHVLDIGCFPYVNRARRRPRADRHHGQQSRRLAHSRHRLPQPARPAARLSRSRRHHQHALSASDEIEQTSPSASRKRKSTSSPMRSPC